jgi:8-oxo-dGTP pyrophosphatase MutT (NUDIX family)
VRVAGVILLREDDAALLQLRDDRPGLRHPGRWVPPGGHCQPGESLEDCARRELFEETGYRCEQMHWLLELIDDDEKDWSSYPLTIYWALYDGRQAVACHEGQAIEFVERPRATDLRVPTYLIRIWDRAIEAFHAHNAAGRNTR